MKINEILDVGTIRYVTRNIVASCKDFSDGHRFIPRQTKIQITNRADGMIYFRVFELDIDDEEFLADEVHSIKGSSLYANSVTEREWHMRFFNSLHDRGLDETH